MSSQVRVRWLSVVWGLCSKALSLHTRSGYSCCSSPAGRTCWTCWSPPCSDCLTPCWAGGEKEVPTLDVVAPDWGIIVNTMSGRRRRHPATAYTHRAHRPAATLSLTYKMEGEVVEVLRLVVFITILLLIRFTTNWVRPDQPCSLALALHGQSRRLSVCVSVIFATTSTTTRLWLANLHTRMQTITLQQIFHLLEENYNLIKGKLYCVFFLTSFRPIS